MIIFIRRLDIKCLRQRESSQRFAVQLYVQCVLTARYRVLNSVRAILVVGYVCWQIAAFSVVANSFQSRSITTFLLLFAGFGHYLNYHAATSHFNGLDVCMSSLLVRGLRYADTLTFEAVDGEWASRDLTASNANIDFVISCLCQAVKDLVGTIIVVLNSRGSDWRTIDSSIELVTSGLDSLTIGVICNNGEWVGAQVACLSYKTLDNRLGCVRSWSKRLELFTSVATTY